MGHIGTEVVKVYIGHIDSMIFKYIKRIDSMVYISDIELLYLEEFS